MSEKRQIDFCPIDPECYYRTKQQVEINTARLDKLENIRIAAIESQILKFIAEHNVAEGMFKGVKSTMFAAFVLVIISVAIIISLFIALASGKITIGELIKLVF